MREHKVSCINLEHIQVMTMCHQFSELIHINGPSNLKLGQQGTPGEFLKLKLLLKKIIPNSLIWLK